MENSIQNKNSEDALISDILQLIANARIKVAAVASAGIATLYWHIGNRINREVLGNKRAEYGKQIVSTLSTQLKLLLLRQRPNFIQKSSGQLYIS